MFQPVTKARIVVLSSATEMTSARGRAWRSMMEHHTATKFSPQAEVGVKCSQNRGPSASRALISGVLCTVELSITGCSCPSG